MAGEVTREVDSFTGAGRDGLILAYIRHLRALYESLTEEAAGFGLKAYQAELKEGLYKLNPDDGLGAAEFVRLAKSTIRGLEFMLGGAKELVVIYGTVELPSNSTLWTDVFERIIELTDHLYVHIPEELYAAMAHRDAERPPQQLSSAQLTLEGFMADRAKGTNMPQDSILSRLAILSAEEKARRPQEPEQDLEELLQKMNDDFYSRFDDMVDKPGWGNFEIYIEGIREGSTDAGEGGEA